MTNHDRARLLESSDQPDYIANQLHHRVSGDVVWGVGLAVTALVRGDGVKAGIGESNELVAPRVPPFGEPMQQDNERTRTGLGDVHVNSVGLDLTVRDLNHDMQVNQLMAPAGAHCPGRAKLKPRLWPRPLTLSQRKRQFR